MKKLILAIVGASIVLMSCTTSKGEAVPTSEQICKAPEAEEVPVRIKCRSKW